MAVDVLHEHVGVARGLVYALDALAHLVAAVAAPAKLGHQHVGVGGGGVEALPHAVDEDVRLSLLLGERGVRPHPLGVRLRPLLLDMMLLRTSADELYEFRLFFDRAYIRLAASRATEELKRRAREAFEGLSRAQRESLPGAEEFDRNFHLAILEATGNEFIIKTGVMIMELCRPHMTKSSGMLDETALENHGKILEIFCSGKTDGLDEAVEKSMSAFRRTLGDSAGAKERRGE